ncbi:MAG: hypothetical protein QXR24_03410 [Thermosphaera sp.]
MVRCPFCGFEADANSFKLLREPWRYRVHEVRRLECPRCKGSSTTTRVLRRVVNTFHFIHD